jgi:hypothetical protein
MKVAIYAVIAVVALWLVSVTNAQENATPIPIDIGRYLQLKHGHADQFNGSSGRQEKTGGQRFR